MRRLIIVAALAAACAPIAAAEPPMQIPLVYDTSDTRAGFTAPQLQTAVEGKDIRFGIDTGAGVHTIASWYVRAAALSPSGADLQVSDSEGGHVSLRVVRDVLLPLAGGKTLLLPEAAVADFPPVFERKGVAGVLSPQLLAPAGLAAVLDLETPVLRFAAFEEATAETHAKQLDAADVTIHASSKPLRNRAYVVRAKIAGAQIRMMLDTGASYTSLGERSGVIKALGPLTPQGFVVGVDGRRQARSSSAPVDVDFGAGPRMIAVSVSRGAASPVADGMLGMDALRTCTLILAESGLAVVCAR